MPLKLNVLSGDRVYLRLPDGRVGWVRVQRSRRGQADLVFELPWDVRIVRDELVEADGSTPGGGGIKGRADTAHSPG